MKRTARILIPNATGPSNIGDQAILSGLLSVLRLRFPGAKICIHSTEPEQYKPQKGVTIKSTLYNWAVFANPSILVRIVRLSQLIGGYWGARLTFLVPMPQELHQLLTDYRTADYIVFVGGGSLRSHKGLTQSLNLLMILSHYQFAKVSNTKIIIAPISFGPFAYRWQEAVAARVLTNVGTIAVRERFSKAALRRHGVTNVVVGLDHAFLMPLSQVPKKAKIDRMIVGFTVRKWLPDAEQVQLEKTIAAALTKFAKHYDALVLPIIQVNSPNFSRDYDVPPTKRVIEQLLANDVTVLPMQVIDPVRKANLVYRKIHLLLGMRMHSTILALMQATPVVAISYEYKAQGISEQIQISDYCIDLAEVTEKKLLNTLINAYEHKQHVYQNTLPLIAGLARKETARWFQQLN